MQRLAYHGKIIRGLSWTISQNHAEIANTSHGPVAYIPIYGQYNHPGWNLVANDRAISPESGKTGVAFNAKLTGPSTLIKITAVGPLGETEEEFIRINFPQYTRFFPDTIKGKTVVDTSILPQDPDFWLIARGAQGVIAYNTDDKDFQAQGSGSALVSLFSAEGRWRAGKKADQRWVWSGSANIEVIRQIVLGTQFILPRGYARLFYGKDTHYWKFGPFLQVQAGRSGVFVPSGETSARTSLVTREGFGAGAFAVYKAAPGVSLSTIGLVRRDFGGGAAQLPNALMPTFGFELGFGVVVGLSSRWMFEGRLRALQENFAWTAASAGAGTSTASYTFVIADVGIGYKLF